MNKKISYLKFTIVIFQIAVLTSCFSSPQENEITISCAMSMKGVIEQVGSAFYRENPDYRVRYNFGPSGKLAEQIRLGAPIDCFLSAGQKEMNALQTGGLIDNESRIDFARNTMVLIAYGSSLSPEIPSLSGVKERIAIGNPETTPAGRYAQMHLVATGILSKLQSRLVYGENVRQVLDYVARGEVDAGIVFMSDYVASNQQVHLVKELPINERIIYPAALLRNSKNKAAVSAFLAFLTSKEGQTILASGGFLPVSG